MASDGARLTRHSASPWNIHKPDTTDSNEVRLNFFSVRVVDKWNDLPESVKSSTSINNFKNNYDSHLALKATIPY